MKNCNSYVPHWACRSIITLIAWSSTCLFLLGQDDEKDDDDLLELSPFSVGSGGGYNATSTLSGARLNSKIGATVGGAQDVAFARGKAKAGEIPPSDSFTPEGLFSEHDLPLNGEAKDDYLIDVVGQAIGVDLVNQPRGDILAQIGFTSGIDVNTWRPAPLNLVAVVDKSGSMSGQPLNLVKMSLEQIATQMGKGDRLSIVLYGATTHIHLEPIEMKKGNRDKVLEAIDQIASQGSTNMESGLKMGFQLARQSREYHEGTTRVMLFTDEQPNVGRTDADGFMEMARTASDDGIGLTTIGVATHFGAALAEKISSVRGGNLFFFSDREMMEEKFRKELDTMVLELAHDLELNIKALDGFEITGLYGIPGEEIFWEKDGSLSMKVQTIFASHSKGAIYFTLGDRRSPFGHRATPIGTEVSEISLKYRQADNQKLRESRFTVPLVDYGEAELGLRKGMYLVDQYTTLKLACLLSENGDHAEAYSSIEGLKQRLGERRELNLLSEAEFVSHIEKAMRKKAKIGSVKAISSTKNEHSFLLGEWKIIESSDGDYESDILRFTETNRVQRFTSTPEDPLHFVEESRYSTSSNRIQFEDWESAMTYQLKRNRLILQSDEGRFRLKRKADYDRKSRVQSSPKDLYSIRINGLPNHPHR